jgi:hypothetical protein
MHVANVNQGPSFAPGHTRGQLARFYSLIPGIVDPGDVANYESPFRVNGTMKRALDR